MAKEAVCWCVEGAATLIAYQMCNGTLFSELLNDAIYIGEGVVPWRINDEQGHQAVLDLLDQLIEKYST